MSREQIVLTVLFLFAGGVSLIALAVWAMLRVYGWLATDKSFWVHVFGG